MKILICGAGRAGYDLHYKNYRDLGIEVVGFYEKSLARTAELKKINENLVFFDNIEEAILKTQCTHVDICTSVKSHFNIASTALGLNKDIIVEKPVTHDTEELKALVSIAKRQSRSITPIHNHRFYPSYVQARKLIKNGAIGEILAVHREFHFCENVRMMDEGHWSHELPGGRLFEANPHSLYLLYSLIGKFDIKGYVFDYPKQYGEYSKISSFTFFCEAADQSIPITINSSLKAESELYGKHGPNYTMIVGSKRTLIITNNGIAFDSHNVAGIVAKLKAKFFQKDYRVEGSGHKQLFSKLQENYYHASKIPLISVEELVFTQELNLKMGTLIERDL